MKLMLCDMPAISSTIPARAAGRAAIPGGHTPYGMESFRGAGSCHAQLHAMPRLGIAAPEKGGAGSLQPRAARHFLDLFLLLFVLRNARNAIEPDLARAAFGPPASVHMGA